MGLPVMQLLPFSENKPPFVCRIFTKSNVFPALMLQIRIGVRLTTIFAFGIIKMKNARRGR